MESVLEIVREMKPELKELPLFLDDTPDMTISYIVDRLFHSVIVKKISCRLLRHPFFKDDGREMVINLVLDKELGYFRKAESLYEEEDSQGIETPMYEWYRDTEYDDWCFEFLDSEGAGITSI